MIHVCSIELLQGVLAVGVVRHLWLAWWIWRMR